MYSRPHAVVSSSLYSLHLASLTWRMVKLAHEVCREGKGRWRKREKERGKDGERERGRRERLIKCEFGLLHVGSI